MHYVCYPPFVLWYKSAVSHLVVHLEFRPSRSSEHHKMFCLQPILQICSARCHLHLQALTWRTLMAFGMNLHKMASPRPRGPSFRKRIPTTLASESGAIDLLFYTPNDYQHPGIPQGSSSPQATTGSPGGAVQGFPVVVNFHGGGFTIGQATDDARWADAVVRNVNAVVVCVEYRLAPKYPFPTAVEDGVDAILYLIANAQDLGIDPDRIALSGFSAGGNLAFTVPLKLQDVIQNLHAGTAELNPGLHPIVAIVSWYPITDFERTAPERRVTNVKPDMGMPSFFTSLFDESYLHPLEEVSLSSPYLSPGLAPVPMLRALPDNIMMYTCEWDDLLFEAEQMRDRLMNEAGKQVIYRNLAGVPHAWDKNPNPFHWDPATEEIYAEACAGLRQAFDQDHKEELK